MASFAQVDDDTPTVEVCPKGFAVVTTKYGPNFRCCDCDVPVEP
jgi:hypothetical protein